VNTWQLSMALGLCASTAFSGVLYGRAVRAFKRSMFFRNNPPVAIRFGWLAIIAPSIEAWVLYKGGFWG
jgi:hypothetical protein